jgi:glucose/arabinose dehydrogenase
VVVYDNLPKDEPHGWKFMALGPDGMLYVPVGAPCNICEPPATHALIRRISTDGKQTEVVARGVRNTVGFDWHPTTKELWFTDNGRDWLGENQPEEELNRVSKTGQHFGYPHCHAGDIPDPQFGKGRSCSEYVAPEAKLGPHAAALGMRFYNGAMFPAEYRNRIIVARHGSWNRAQKSGFDLVHVMPGQSKMETFASGWLQGDTFWGRPTDVQVLRDGSLLVSDDFAGAIYRISYKR